MQLNAVQALHTAARRYCADRDTHWRAAQADLCRLRDDRVRLDDGSCTDSSAARRIYGRYRELVSILADVERFVPEDFAGIDEARSYLAAAGAPGRQLYPHAELSVERAAAEEEQGSFAEWVRRVGLGELSTIRPLPYRRVLGTAELRRLDERLAAAWGNWYGGVADRTDIPPTLTLWDHWFEDEHHLSGLRAAIAGRGHARVWELREWDESFELDVGAAKFAYNAEGFWTAGDMDWMVYASHESSITFGGDWLIDTAKRACPDWEAGLYAGWNEESPRRG